MSGLTAREAFQAATKQAGELDKAKKQLTRHWKQSQFQPAQKIWLGMVSKNLEFCGEFK